MLYEVITYLWLLGASIGVNYALGVVLGLPSAPKSMRRTALILGIVFNLGLLGYFKYANFGMANLNAVLEAAGMNPFVFGRITSYNVCYTKLLRQAVTASDIVETDPISPNVDSEGNSYNRDKSRNPNKNYLALREFWIDYSGLTPYPA